MKLQTMTKEIKKIERKYMDKIGNFIVKAIEIDGRIYLDEEDLHYQAEIHRKMGKDWERKNKKPDNVATHMEATEKEKKEYEDKIEL